MSTQPRQQHTTQPTRTASTPPQFTTRNAPRTFNPHNTDPCPQMFADKWTTDE